MIRYKRGALAAAFKLALPAIKYLAGYSFEALLSKSIRWFFSDADIGHVSDQIEIYRHEASDRQSHVNYDDVVSSLLDNVIGKPLNLNYHQKKDYSFWAVQNRLTLLTAKLSRLAHKSMIGELDIDLLFELTQLDNLKQIDSSSVVLEEIRQPHNTKRILIFEFTARNIEMDTRIYRVEALPYWSNLTGNPVRKEYIGHGYAAFNTSSNCLRAIKDHTLKFITTECVTKNFVDPLLKRWKITEKVDDLTLIAPATFVIEGVLTNNVYCFGQNITFNSKTVECPPYSFKMPRTMDWNTEDYNWQAVDKTESHDKPIENIMDLLIAQMSDSDRVHTSILAALKTFRALQEQAKGVDFAKILEKNGISITATLILMNLLLLFIASITSYLLWKDRKPMICENKSSRGRLTIS